MTAGHKLGQFSTNAKDLLTDLSFGQSVAEFDRDLKDYFLETEPFRQLVADDKDIIAGDKGTGKTAIFKVLHERYAHIPSLRHVVVVPAFNLSGDPVFQDLAKRGVKSEGEYIAFWKAYFLALVGHWLLKHNRYDRRSTLGKLDQLLRGLQLRSELDAPRPIFDKIMEKAEGLFAWQSAEVRLEAAGVSLTPRIEFDSASGKEVPVVPIAGALQLLQQALLETDKVAWIAIDRLDEAFQGYPEVEIPALRALFRTYLDLIEFPRLKPKLFVRKDLFRRIVDKTFVNLTHINARKVDVIWDEEDLLNLLSRRVKQNKTFCSLTGMTKLSDQEIFDRLFPQQVDQGSRKPGTWVWMIGRIKDGAGVKPPRNLIDLVSMAKDAQVRKENREPRVYDREKPLIEAESLRKALTQLSEQRVNDTLMAEARNLSSTLEKFRNGKAEYSEKSISAVLGVEPDKVKECIISLKELGFLEESGGTYKIPMLYRAGLGVTQGKSSVE